MDDSKMPFFKILRLTVSVLLEMITQNFVFFIFSYPSFNKIRLKLLKLVSFILYGFQKLKFVKMKTRCPQLSSKLLHFSNLQKGNYFVDRLIYHCLICLCLNFFWAYCNSKLAIN